MVIPFTPQESADGGKLRDEIQEFLTVNTTKKGIVIDLKDRKVKNAKYDIPVLCEAIVHAICHPNVSKVLVNDQDYFAIHGKCKGLLLDEFASFFNSPKYINCFGQKVDFDDILSTEALTIKIQFDVECNTESNYRNGEIDTRQFGEVCRFLQQLLLCRNTSDFPMSFVAAVCRLERKFKLRRRVLNRSEKRLFRKSLIFKMAEEPTSESLQDDDDETLNEELPQHKLSNENIQFNGRDYVYKCYCCHTEFSIDPSSMSSYQIHYTNMCDSCAKLNYLYRDYSTDLSGRYAIVTGGRIKIGFEIVIKLLNAGCFVIVTTRFPHDALKRFANHKNFNCWSKNLRIFPLDLHSHRSIIEFCDYVTSTIPHLDILINNAAQTLARPVEFYQHLIENELSSSSLTTEERTCLVRSLSFPESIDDNEVPCKRLKIDESSQAILPHERYFPLGVYDSFGQQVDKRYVNSWVLKLNEIPVKELIDVFTVNTVAPFVLIKGLSEHIEKSPQGRKFIVNVSAMEGQFNRKSKTMFHPHTNMAKAALNMLTRTSGIEYSKKNIYMTAVDTGWVTDERPYHRADEASKNGFILPLDCIDGASRVLHPVFEGIKDTLKTPYFAVFLKNYGVFPW